MSLVSAGLVVLSLALGMQQLPPEQLPPEQLPSGHRPAMWAPPLAVTAADAARCYLAFDSQLVHAKLDGPRRAALARTMDTGVRSLMAGNYWVAVQQFNRIAQLFGDGAPLTPSRQVMESLKATPRPPVWVIGSKDGPKVRVSSSYQVTGMAADTVNVRLIVRDHGGQQVFEAAILPADPEKGVVDCLVALELNLQREETYTLSFVADGVERDAGVIGVAPERPAALRETLEKRIAGLPSGNGSLDTAVNILKSRLSLLADTNSDTRYSPLLADTREIMGDLKEESAAIERGENPYRGRPGDLWFTLQTSGGELPLRLHAPASDAANAARPLVVALSGFGDENILLDGFGEGRLKELADSKGFLVVCAATTPFLSSSSDVGSIVAVIEQIQAVDRNRVYLLGHSAGGGAALVAAAMRPDLPAAVVSLAGATGFEAGQSLPPALLVTAKDDSIVFPWVTRTMLESASKAGLAIEHRELKGVGHLTLVAEALPEVIDWLLSHRRGARGDEPAARGS